MGNPEGAKPGLEYANWKAGESKANSFVEHNKALADRVAPDKKWIRGEGVGAKPTETKPDSVPVVEAPTQLVVKEAGDQSPRLQFPAIGAAEFTRRGGNLTELMGADKAGRMIELNEKLENGESFSDAERNDLMELRQNAKELINQWKAEKDKVDEASPETTNPDETTSTDITPAVSSPDITVAVGTPGGVEPSEIKPADEDGGLDIKISETVEPTSEEPKGAAASESKLYPQAEPEDLSDIDIELSDPETGLQESSPEQRSAQEVGRERRQRTMSALRMFGGKVSGALARVGRGIDHSLDVAFAPGLAAKEKGREIKNVCDSARESMDRKVNSIVTSHREKVQANRERRQTIRAEKREKVKDHKLQLQIDRAEKRIKNMIDLADEALSGFAEAQEAFNSDIRNAEQNRLEAQALRDEAERIKSGIIVRAPKVRTETLEAPTPEQYETPAATSAEPIEQPKTAPEAEDFKEATSETAPEAEESIPEVKSAREVGAERRKAVADGARKAVESVQNGLDYALGGDIALKNGVERAAKTIDNINQKAAEGIGRVTEKGAEIRRDLQNGIKNIDTRQKVSKIMAESTSRDWAASNYRLEARKNLGKMDYFVKMFANRKAAVAELTAARDALLAQRTGAGQETGSNETAAGENGAA